MKWLGLVSLLAISNNVNALQQDIIRECSKQTCASSQGDKQVLLTCGGSGEVISKVTFSSFGLPQGDCPAINQDFFEGEVFDVNITDGCSASKSVSVVEEACVGKEECTLDLNELFSLSDAGLESCGVTGTDQLEFTVLVECGDTFDAFTIVTALLIAVIGLALGASVEVHDFIKIFRAHKRAVFVGFFCQFGFMPLIAFSFAKAFDFDPRVQLGMILVGASPGGTTSNLLTYYAKGNVALSIVMSSVSTLAALFMIPLLVFLYLEKGLGVDEEIKIPFQNIFSTLLIAILPAALGVYIRYKNEIAAQRVEKIGSIIGALFILAALALGVVENPELFEPTKYGQAWVASCLFQPIGCLLGYCTARLIRLPHPEARAVCLETGVQNFVLALAIITISFSGCDRIIISTFPLISTFWYLLNSIWITAFLRFVMAPRDTPKEVHDVEAEQDSLKTLGI